MRMAMIVLAIAIMSEQNRKIKLAINLARLQLILVQSALLFVLMAAHSSRTTQATRHQAACEPGVLRDGRGDDEAGGRGWEALAISSGISHVAGHIRVSRGSSLKA